MLVYDADGSSCARTSWRGARRRPLLDLDAQPELRTAVRRAIDGEPPPAELSLTVYEPERRRYRVHLEPFARGSGRACVVVLEDESAEADYRDARRLFSAGVSHELRTPLQRILGLVETLGARPGGRRPRRHSSPRPGPRSTGCAG